MAFSFVRTFHTLLRNQAPGDDLFELSPEFLSEAEGLVVTLSTPSPVATNVVEPSIPAAEIAETVEERPFHIFEAQIRGEGALIFVLPPNQPEGEDVKRFQRQLRRQQSKARDVSRRDARRAKQSW